MSTKKFPFKSIILYKVKKDFHFPSSDFFLKDELLYYVRSEYNHYDGIEICFFRDKQSTKLLRWSMNDHELRSWQEYLELAS